MILNQLIINIAFLIVAAYFYGINLRLLQSYPVRQQLVSGFLFGLISMLSMVFSFELNSGLIFDGRSIVLGLSGIFGGVYGASISVFIALIYRVLIGGQGLFTGISVILFSGFTGAFVHTYLKNKSKKLNYFQVYIFGLFIHIITVLLFLTIPETDLADIIAKTWKPFILLFPFVTLFIYFIFSDRQIRIKEEKDLIEQKKLFETMFDTISDGVVITNTKREILLANKGMLTTFGYQPQELIGKSTQMLYSDKINFNDAGANLFDFEAKNTNGTFITHYKTKNQNVFLGETFGAKLFDMEEKWIGNLGIIKDITERNDFINEIKIAKAKAEESDQLKTAFLANMSHEIRTPMNAVLGFAQLLVQKNLDPNERTIFAEYIRLNGESLLKIIDDIIDISKIQAKQLTIFNKEFDLHKVFVELEQYYKRLLLQKIKNEIELIVALPQSSDNPFYICTDEIRLKQILNNLILNTITHAGKCTLTIGYLLKDNSIHFFVKDTGRGIATKYHSKIFERFVQYSNEYLSRQEGTGLGLPISKELVTVLGGVLKLESREGLGATFYFEIPLNQKKQDKVIKRAPRKLNFTVDLSAFSILIADDELSNFALAKHVLLATRINIDWAKNGKEAIDMANVKNYDLILMDIKMPGLDGIEATRNIRKTNTEVPIIVQTAFAIPDIKQAAFDAGCNDFIVKPIDLDDFLMLVSKFLNNN
jgi:PAS domain S-box-containing protein